jgi:hypothetical protein
MNISEQPLDSRYLRKHPKSYTEEPMGKIEFDDPTFRKSVDTLHDEGVKLGGRSVLNAKVKELIRENEELRARVYELRNGENSGDLVQYLLTPQTGVDTTELGQDIYFLYKMIEGIREAERKRSARWKAIAKCYHESYYALEEFVTELLEVKQ